jgi:hypothetical protein
MTGVKAMIVTRSAAPGLWAARPAVAAAAVKMIQAARGNGSAVSPLAIAAAAVVVGPRIDGSGTYEARKAAVAAVATEASVRAPKAANGDGSSSTAASLGSS